MFSFPRRWSLFAAIVVLMAAALPAMADDAGQDDLDEAVRLKIAAENIDDLGKVIDKLDSAIEKGLEKDNNDNAKQMLMSTLFQRASAFSGAIFNVPVQDPRATVQVMQLRQFALNDLQRIVDTDGQMWDAYLLMGRLHSLPLGDPNAARRALSTVVDAKDAPVEDRAQAYALRSVVQRDPDRQAEDLNKAVELQPTKPDYYRLRARYRQAKEKYDDALADVDKALELDKDHVATLEQRGLILLSLDRYDDALKSFDKAGELDPDSALPFQQRGELFRQKGDLSKAAEQLSKAIEKSPENIGSLLLRAGIYYELKETDKALADVEQIIKLRPDFLQAHLMRAEIYANSGNLDKAISALERLSQLAPGQQLILNQLGSMYMVAGKPRKAIGTLTQIIKLDPTNVRTLRLRGDAYLRVGQHAEAVADFAKALEQSEDPDDGLLNNFAWVLATSPMDDVRDGKKAVKLATQACEEAGYDVPHILSTLAASYAETGDFESAMKWSEKAVECSQKEVDKANADPTTKEDVKAELLKSHEQLKAELANYHDKKPVRERQNEEDDAKDAGDVKTPAAGEGITRKGPGEE